MKYKNTSHKKAKNTHPLEVSCGVCKTPIAIYEKAGKGNLIKLQAHRIIESQFDLATHKGHLFCVSCGEHLANRGVYRENLTFFVVRGMINIKKLNNYFY